MNRNCMPGQQRVHACHERTPVAGERAFRAGSSGRCSIKVSGASKSVLRRWLSSHQMYFLGEGGEGGDCGGYARGDSSYQAVGNLVPACWIVPTLGRHRSGDGTIKHSCPCLRPCLLNCQLQQHTIGRRGGRRGFKVAMASRHQHQAASALLVDIAAAVHRRPLMDCVLLVAAEVLPQI